MDKIIHIDSVSKYNALRGAETLHPLVTVLNYDNLTLLESGTYNFGLYSIFLKETKCGDLKYGKQTYDYQEESLVFVGPGQILTVEKYAPGIKPKGMVLLFHPDFVKGTHLGRNMNQYSFFAYASNEALHLSKRERDIVTDLFEKIQFELQHAIDKHSKTLIVSTIEMLLNYSTRFYDRQFITREQINTGVLEKFETLLNNYFSSDMPQHNGLPSVAYCADALHLSANYFGDLVKKETGRSAQEYIQAKIMDVAKERIFDLSKSVSEVAYEMGFKYPNHFSRMFKNSTGQSPNEYRNLN